MIKYIIVFFGVLTLNYRSRSERINEEIDGALCDLERVQTESSQCLRACSMPNAIVTEAIDRAKLAACRYSEFEQALRNKNDSRISL